jgi:hypothetical protein
MRILALVGVCLLSLSTASAAGLSLTYGRGFFDGDVCEDCDAVPEDANLLGLRGSLGMIPLVDLGLGAEYGSSDFGSGGCGAGGDLAYYRVYAYGTLPVVTLVVANAYLGAMLSYDRLDLTDVDCREGDTTRTGYTGLAGVEITPPGLPVGGFLEGRYGRLTGSPDITVSGVCVGLTLSL